MGPLRSVVAMVSDYFRDAMVDWLFAEDRKVIEAFLMHQRTVTLLFRRMKSGVMAAEIPESALLQSTATDYDSSSRSTGVRA